MNILFLIPPADLNRKKLPIDRVYGCNYGFDYKPPIHLLQLATIAKEFNYNVKLLDCIAEGYNHKQLEDYILKNRFDIDLVVFFTVWLSAEVDREVAKNISSLIEKANFIFTGSYPTWRPEVFIKNDKYFVIRGEPDAGFKEFLKVYQSTKNYADVKNLSFYFQGNIRHNPSGYLIDLDNLPIPDRSLLKGRYFFNRINSYPATIACFSRGCSYRCTYCAPHALDQAIELECLRQQQKKPPLRLRSIEKVVQEFKQIHSFGYKGVEICDNQFVWDNVRVMAICEQIKDFNLEWICYARPDHIKDRAMVKMMYQAGCRLVYLGTESFNQEILNDIGKEMRVKDIFNAVQLLKESNIEPEVSVLFGASFLETKTSIFNNIKEARKINTNFVHYSIALPLPNTALYKTAVSKGLMSAGDFSPVDNVREGIIDLPNISAKELKAIVRDCYFKQYFSFRFILRQLAKPYFFKTIIMKTRVFLRLIKYLSPFA